MLQSLRTKNFQSHKDTLLRLHPGVNVIVGQSQNGKSALLRSLVWLKDNRPLGFRFHSWFAGEKEPTEVECRVDGISVVKSKAKGKTTYHVSGKELDYREGKGIPDEVTRLLNMSELNVQTQLDPFFLITSSPQEVARTFNQVTKVEQADDWVRKLTSMINKNSTELEVLRGEIGEMEEELKGLPDLTKAKRGLKKMKTMVADYEFYSRERVDISNAIDSIRDAERVLEEKYSRMPDPGGLDGLEGERAKLVMVQEELRELNRVMEGIVSTLKEVEEATGEQDRAKKNYLSFLTELGKCPVCYGDIDEDRVEELI